MGHGYGGSTPVQTLSESAEGSKRKSSTPPFRISLTRQKKSGLKRSLLKRLNGKPKSQEHSGRMDGLFLLLIKIYQKMIEAAIPVVIAIVTGTAVLFNKVNTRVTTLDNRVDKLELKLVESYTSKQEFTQAMIRMGDHLIRIEDKMDQLIAKKWD